VPDPLAINVLTVADSAAIGGCPLVAGTDLTVCGTSQLTGDVGLGGVPVAGTDLTVYGTTTLSGAVTAGASLTVQGGLGVMIPSGGVTELGRSAAMGYGINVAYSAANFTAGAGAWTVDAGDQVILRYTLVGKTMLLMFYLNTTSVSVATNELRIKIPGGFAVSSSAYGTGIWTGESPMTTGPITATYTLAYVALNKAGFANFATATNTLSVRGSITFEIA
jgi:hypothetical protein